MLCKQYYGMVVLETVEAREDGGKRCWYHMLYLIVSRKFYISLECSSAIISLRNLPTCTGGCITKESLSSAAAETLFGGSNLVDLKENSEGSCEMPHPQHSLSSEMH